MLALAAIGERLGGGVAGLSAIVYNRRVCAILDNQGVRHGSAIHASEAFKSKVAPPHLIANQQALASCAGLHNAHLHLVICVDVGGSMDGC